VLPNLVHFALGDDGVDGFFVGELLVEVRDVHYVFRELRLERSLDPLVHQLLDIY